MDGLQDEGRVFSDDVNRIEGGLKGKLSIMSSNASKAVLSRHSRSGESFQKGLISGGLYIPE